MLDSMTRKQLEKICEKHKKLDEYFLDNYIQQRVIVFIADDTDINGMKFGKHDVAILQNRNPNNIAININKFIAKYDYDIAKKVKPTLDDLSDDNEKPLTPEPEEVTKKRFRDNAILEILQICTSELSRDNSQFESIWTLSGKQVVDLNELESDCKICLVSKLPQHNRANRNVRKHLPKSMHNMPTPLEGSVNMQGLRNNHFAVSSWKGYYQQSVKQAEIGVRNAKNSWFLRTHDQWIEQNNGLIEDAHIQAELKSQRIDPRPTISYVRKEPDARDDKLAAPLDNGLFWQKEKFIFKDF